MPTYRCAVCGTTETGSAEFLDRYWLRSTGPAATPHAPADPAPVYCGAG